MPAHNMNPGLLPSPCVHTDWVPAHFAAWHRRIHMHTKHFEPGQPFKSKADSNQSVLILLALNPNTSDAAFLHGLAASAFSSPGPDSAAACCQSLFSPCCRSCSGASCWCCCCCWRRLCWRHMHHTLRATECSLRMNRALLSAGMRRSCCNHNSLLGGRGAKLTRRSGLLCSTGPVVPSLLLLVVALLLVMLLQLEGGGQEVPAASAQSPGSRLLQVSCW